MGAGWWAPCRCCLCGPLPADFIPLHVQLNTPVCSVQELVLAVPPPIAMQQQAHPMFTATHFGRLAWSVDGFSLMTYDYNVGRPGPNAPLPWVRANLDALLPEANR